jgi:hypothetical protein
MKQEEKGDTHMVKKLTALLLCLLMLCTLASAETVDYSGVWYLVSVESNGIALNPSDIGMEMTMTLNADGTGVVTITDEDDSPATWVLDGETLTVTADEQPLAFTMTEDGQLVADNAGNNMYFGREPAGPGFVPAAEIVAEDIAAFDGTWSITTVNAFGMVVPFSAMAEMGMADGNVVILDGSVTSLGMPDAEVGTLEDGKLVVVSPIEGSYGKTFSLLEDGTLAMSYMEMVFYCEKVVVEE